VEKVVNVNKRAVSLVIFLVLGAGSASSVPVDIVFHAQREVGWNRVPSGLNSVKPRWPPVHSGTPASEQIISQLSRNRSTASPRYCHRGIRAYELDRGI